MLWIEKYRPSTFEEVLGQSEVIQHLKLFAEEGNVPHMLLAGPHGTGKSAATECLARALYGDFWQENMSVLNTGLLFHQGKKYLEAEERFAHLYQKDGSLITNFKHIVKWYASMRPLDADFKLMVFEGAEALTFEAQQALRRIMERYSATCRFIFVAPNQSAIIPAISSRCLPLFFAPIGDGIIHSQLKLIRTNEGFSEENIPEDDLELIVRASEGDLRKAIMYLQLILKTDREVDLIEISQSETASISASIFSALRSQDLKQASQLAEMLMIDYGLSGKEVIGELRSIAGREYNDPRIALALADGDYRMGHAGNEFVQINALLAHIIEEVFN